jgi:hypothetical protein
MKFMFFTIVAFVAVLIFDDYVFNHGDSTEAVLSYIGMW